MHMVMPTRVGRGSYSSAYCDSASWSDAGVFAGKQCCIPVVMPGDFTYIDVPSFMEGYTGRGDHPVAHAQLIALGSGVPGTTAHGTDAYPNREFHYTKSNGKYSSYWIRGYFWDEIGAGVYYAQASAYSNKQIRFSVNMEVCSGYWNGSRPYQRYIQHSTTCNFEYPNTPHIGTPTITGNYRNYEWGLEWAKGLIKVSDGVCPWKWSNSDLDVPTVEPFLKEMAAVALKWLKDYRIKLRNNESVKGKSSKSVTLEKFSPIIPNCGRDKFVFNELATRFYGDDALISKRYLGDNAGFFLREAEERAYVDAITNVPRMNDNNIQNLGEIAKFIYTLVVEHRIEVPKSLSDAWLQYRYQYTTTKLDAQEAIEFVHRHMNLPEGSDFSVYGYGNCSYHGVTGTVEVGFRVSPKDVSTLGRVWKALYTYGLEPDFYVVWDAIPFSFIVDWLIPVGDIAATADAQRYLKRTFDISHINWSLSYTYVAEDGLLYRCYTRWQAPVPDRLTGLYLFDKDRTSKKVWGYRMLDAGSLILG